MTPPTTPLPKKPEPWRGLVGGLIGGLAAGLVGGGLGHAIELMDAPPLDQAISGAIRFGLVGLVLGGLTGLACGCVIGLVRGRRGAFGLPLAAVFGGGLVGAIETWQGDVWSGVAAFGLGVGMFTLLGLGLAAGLPLLWKGRWLVAAFLVLCLVGEVIKHYSPLDSPGSDQEPTERVVQLWNTPLPQGLGCIAEHHWLLVFDPEEKQWHRWEVMELDVLGGDHWGFLYQDRYEPHGTFGGGPPRLVKEWKGTDADSLAAVLERAPEYPLKDRYLAWPGPNCNTFVSWVLREAGVSCDMGPKSLGDNYLGSVVGVSLTPGASGVQFESASVGVRAGWREGLELHVCCFVFGIDLWTPGVKTPFGRFGFPED